MSIHNVLVIGGGGNLGPSVLRALESHSFTATVLSRSSSKSTFPPSVRVVRIDDAYPHAALVSAFRGQDAVISTISGHSLSTQTKFIDAALEAGVPRFVPAEFGGDTLDDALVEGNPLFQGKRDVLDYLTKSEAKLGWTAIASGPFFDWCLAVGFFKIDVKGRKAMVLDGGEATFPTTNLDTVGVAVARALKREDTRNKYLYVRDFMVSPNQIIAEFERQTGEKFEVERMESKPYTEEAQAELKKGNMGALYNLIFAQSMAGSPNWKDKKGFANDLLELPKADFEATIKNAIEASK